MPKKSKAQWLIDLLNEVDGYIDDKELAKILEKRGRTCVGPNYIKKAKDAARNTKSIDDFVKKLSKTLPMLKKEGDKVYMVYPKCYCHHIKGLEGDIPKSYCYCSIGWVKELFEQALNKPINVKLESSILGGDKTCRLRVAL